MSASDNVAINVSELKCRGCLKDWGEMKNIFQWGLDYDFFKYTGIPRDQSGLLPVLLCAPCEYDLQKTKTFTEKCQLSDRTLKINLKNSINGPEKTTQGQVTSILNNKTVLIQITAPDPEEKVKLPCPYENCASVFLKRDQLRFHITQKHKDNPHIELEYYCSENDCAYNKNSNVKKYFSGRKFLNQHSIKKHKVKTVACDSCHAKFATEIEHARHLKTCAIIYICYKCGNGYTTNEAYLVHLLRKHPKLHQEYKQAKKRPTDMFDMPIKKKAKYNKILNNTVIRPLIGTPAKIIPLRTGISIVSNQNSNEEFIRDNITEISEPYYTPKISEEIDTRSESMETLDLIETTRNDTPDTTNKKISKRARAPKNKRKKVELNKFSKVRARKMPMQNDIFANIEEFSKDRTPEMRITEIIQEDRQDIQDAEILEEQEQVIEILGTVDESIEADCLPTWGLNIDVFETTISPDEEYEAKNYDEYDIEKEIADNIEIVKEESNIGDNNEIQIEEVMVIDNICQDEIEIETLKRTSATQFPEDITNDISLNSWSNKNDFEILKSQHNIEETFFTESVSLSDIQTQTVPYEFGLSRCNKETQACTSINPDLKMQETQTCFCLYDSYKPFDSLSLSTNNFISTQTQTLDLKSLVRRDEMLSVTTAETQTCFESSSDGSM